MGRAPGGASRLGIAGRCADLLAGVPGSGQAWREARGPAGAGRRGATHAARPGDATGGARHPGGDRSATRHVAALYGRPRWRSGDCGGDARAARRASGRPPLAPPPRSRITHVRAGGGGSSRDQARAAPGRRGGAVTVAIADCKNRARTSGRFARILPQLGLAYAPRGG